VTSIVIPAHNYDDEAIGKPDAGNPHVRFDEGVVGANPTALLYRFRGKMNNKQKYKILNLSQDFFFFLIFLFMICLFLVSFNF